MEVVVDASAILAVVLDEPERQSIIDASENCVLIAPSALPFEIANALTAMCRRERIEPGSVLPVWRATQRIPVQLASVELEATLELAMAEDIYAYDAYYLQCALSLRTPLVTLDRGMRAVAERLGIRLLV